MTKLGGRKTQAKTTVIKDYDESRGKQQSIWWSCEEENPKTTSRFPQAKRLCIRWAKEVMVKFKGIKAVQPLSTFKTHKHELPSWPTPRKPKWWNKLWGGQSCRDNERESPNKSRDEEISKSKSPFFKITMSFNRRGSFQQKRESWKLLKVKEN